MKRVLPVLLCVLLALPGLANAKNRDVKAGVFAFDGYHEIDSAGHLGGYGIDFLNLASRYSNLNFDLQGFDKSWREMLEMLKKGEIDLVTSARRTPEREEIFAFSIPIGKNATLLSTKADNTKLRVGDYRHWNGMRIGILKGSTQNALLKKYADSKGFEYEPVEFDDSHLLANALQTGHVDAILTSNLRKARNEKTLDTIDSSNFYAIVRKDDQALLDELNYAIGQMDQNEGDWRNILFYKNYGPREPSTTSFTDRESRYARAARSAEAAIIAQVTPNRAPYAYIEDGYIKGILPDYFRLLMDKALLPYKLVRPGEAPAEEVNVIIDSVVPHFTKEGAPEAGFDTPPYLVSGIAQVSRGDFKGPIARVAITDTQSLPALQRHLPRNARHVHYADQTKAMEAVASGEADAAYVDGYAAQNFVNKNPGLVYNMLNDAASAFRMRVPPGSDHELITILGKAMRLAPEDAINQLILKYTAPAIEEVTLGQYLRKHPGAVFIGVILIALIIVVIISLYFKSWANRKLMLKEQEQKAELAVALARANSANVAKTRFLNNMSHDIRTPMNAIIGFTHLASSSLSDSTLLRGYLGKIMTSGNHLLSLINDVLDMSRIESGKVELDEKEIGIPEIIRDLRVIAQSDINSKDLSFKISALNITNENIICDKLRLNQALINILSNAIKYTMPGGSVAVTFSQTGEAVGGRAPYEIRVKDTGIGMSAEFLKRVFEPFERERTSTVSGIQGTGLGLAITKNIVNMMGGEIRVESEAGKGSEFIASFNFKVARAGEKADFGEFGRCLLVWADAEEGANLARLLNAAGIATDLAASAQEALDLAASGRPYGVWIIDEDAGGAGLAAKAAAFQPRALVLAGWDWEESEARQAGVTGFCAKPVFLSGLRAALASDSQPAAESAETPAFEGRRALLVDDNELNREIGEMILENMGMEVDTATDGSEAVEMVKSAQGSPWDIILMDVQMPEMDGYAATRAIRALSDPEKSAITIVAMTANAFEEDRKEAMEAGMNGYVAKPIDLKQLAGALKEAFAAKNIRAEGPQAA